MAGRLNQAKRGEKGREKKRGAAEQERWPQARDWHGIAKMAELQRGQAGGGEAKSPAPGREGLRVGDGVRSAGWSHRYRA